MQLHGGVVHVLLIDKTGRPARVWLDLPATGAGTVQRLLAPSVASTSGVTLDGQSLSPQALWHGSRHTETVNKRPGGYPISLTPYSAALVTLKGQLVP